MECELHLTKNHWWGGVKGAGEGGEGGRSSNCGRKQEHRTTAMTVPAAGLLRPLDALTPSLPDLVYYRIGAMNFRPEFATGAKKRQKQNSSDGT